ncbi:MAG: hypothetical protein IT315_00795 [Anaerolineales bacterium]|nr:hypothetical protein [Anaerolineales bacterium]
MNTWHAKSLGDGMWAPAACAEIEEKFQPIFESAGKPITMAVFARREEGNVHCEVIAFFSPAMREFAESFGASPCVPPMREGLELLAGDKNCWSVLFS